MIQITRSPAPAGLTPAFVATQTARFQADGSSVWNIDEVRNALSAMSRDKCAYCEIMLGEGATYLEVEHFYAKTSHPTKVIEWDNLLPACRRCNAHKGKWDVAVPGNMMVDPVTDTPVDHIRMKKTYMLIARTVEGSNTVEEINLNDMNRLAVPRYKLGEIFKRKLDDLRDRYTSLPSNVTLRKRRALIRKIKEALGMSRSDQPFSAVIATILERSVAYRDLKDAMITQGDWDQQLQDDHDSAMRASLA